MAELTLKTFDYKIHTIHLSGEVNESMFNTLNEKILEIEGADNEVIYENTAVLGSLGIEVSVSRPKIVIYLSTYGGVVYDGLAIYDLLKDMQKEYEIDLICSGKIMSMGAIIMLAVDKDHRFAYKNTTFMIHQLASLTMGKLGDMKQDMNECERLENLMSDIILSNTKITKKQLTDVYDKKKDWYFSAEEAQKLQMIKEVI